MRILEVNIPSRLAANFGLGPVLLRGLGQVVVIAGKNGAGKTRLLNCVNEFLGRWTEPTHLEERRRNRRSGEERLVRIKAELNQNLNPSERENKCKEFEGVQEYVLRIDEEIEVITAVKTTGGTASRSMLDFVPRHLQLSNPSDWNRNTLRDQSAHATNANIDAWHTTMPGKIQHCIDRYFDATHP